MEQAEALLHWRDYDEAERLAQDVSRLGVDFGPYDAHPQRLLDRIAADRRGGAASQPAGVARTATPAGSEAAQLAKARAVELLAASRAALAKMYEPNVPGGR